MTKSVLCVGFAFPGGLADFVPLSSKRSLLDADLVIFRPAIGPFDDVDFRNPTYQGRPALTDDASFRLKDAASHWRQQIRLAIQSGKTVIVFLPAPEIVWVDSGQRQYSGTGRNRQTTRVVESFNTSSMLPTFSGEVVASEGTQMELTNRGNVLSEYWAEFGPESTYKAVFNDLKVSALVTAAGGKIPVACSFSMQGATGRVIVLPALTAYDVDPIGIGLGSRWDKTDKVFGQRLLKALINLDSKSRSDNAVTPPPEWEARDEFSFERERELRRQILEIDGQVESALNQKATLAKQLDREGELRRLLYEKGSALEKAILLALRILGFSAEPFKNAESEFDAVFVSPEGRFLGEAEGKDKKAINIDKLRQLEMNVQEDYARDEVNEYARAVLFGNAFRLQEPVERTAEWFTEKCVTAAKRSGTALIRTSDLFFAAKLVKETGDEAHALACRQAILQQGGKVVEFPSLPIQEAITSTAANRS